VGGRRGGRLRLTAAALVAASTAFAAVICLFASAWRSRTNLYLSARPTMRARRSPRGLWVMGGPASTLTWCLTEEDKASLEGWPGAMVEWCGREEEEEAVGESGIRSPSLVMGGEK